MLTLVIPAAGRGSRLSAVCRGRPKCLIEVGGRPIMHYAIDAGLLAPVDRIVIVVSPAGAVIREAIGQHYAGVPITSTWTEGDTVKGSTTIVKGTAIATFVGGRGAGRHLVLNGHLDVFPVGDRAAWTRDPWSGEIVDGRLHGRGTVYMKCGTTARRKFGLPPLA